jgi:hypothetical protein
VDSSRSFTLKLSARSAKMLDWLSDRLESSNVQAIRVAVAFAAKHIQDGTFPLATFPASNEEESQGA